MKFARCLSAVSAVFFSALAFAGDDSVSADVRVVESPDGGEGVSAPVAVTGGDGAEAVGARVTVVEGPAGVPPPGGESCPCDADWSIALTGRAMGGPAGLGQGWTADLSLTRRFGRFLLRLRGTSARAEVETARETVAVTTSVDLAGHAVTKVHRSVRREAGEEGVWLARGGLGAYLIRGRGFCVSAAAEGGDVGVGGEGENGRIVGASAGADVRLGGGFNLRLEGGGGTTQAAGEGSFWEAGGGLSIEF
jgi:hypothetical protein